MSAKIIKIVNDQINNTSLREEALAFVLKGLKQSPKGDKGWQTLAAMNLCEKFLASKAREKHRAKAAKSAHDKAAVKAAISRVDFVALAKAEREREAANTLKLEIGQSTTLEWDGRVRKNQLHIEEQNGTWVRVVLTNFCFIPFSWEYELSFNHGLCTITRTK